MSFLSTYTVVSFFEQRNKTQLQTLIESSMNKYIRKVKETFRIDLTGRDRSVERKLKEIQEDKESLYLSETQPLGY